MEKDATKKVIEDKDGTFGDIMIMALRYALGRRTYVTNEVPDFIKNNSDYITERICIVMLRDITYYVDNRKIGLIHDDKCDYDSWIQFKNFLFNLAKIKNYNIVGYMKR